MTISYLAKYLWDKKWLILIPTLITFSLSWLLTRNLNPGYTSTAELSTGYMDIAISGGGHGGNTKALFNNVIQTLQSNQILDQVSYKLLYHDLSSKVPFRSIEDTSVFNHMLKTYPGGEKGLLKSLSSKIDSFYILNLAITGDRQIRKLADLYQYSPNSLMENVQIQRVGESDFIKVTSTTESPNLSAFISNEICSRFLALYQTNQGTSASASLEALKELVATKKKIFDSKLSLLPNSTDQDASNPNQMLNILRAQFVQQKSELISTQAELKNLNDLIQNTDNTGGIADNEDVIAIRNNMDDLYEKYVDGGMKDNSLLNQIGQLRAQLQQKLSEIGNISEDGSLASLQRRKMSLDLKISIVKQTINDLQDNIQILERADQSTTPNQGILQGIQSEIEVARQQYIQANNLYNQAMNQNRFPGNNFEQVLHASPPLYPDPSKRAKIVGFAGSGIFFVLIFLFLAFEFIDSSIKTPSFLRANLSIPLLATLKQIRSKKHLLENSFSNSSSLHQSIKEFRDQIKQLRYELEKSNKKIFLFTGYHSASGKTTIIESLAGSFTLKNKKVLLIDANFSNNTLSRKYGVKNTLEKIKMDADGTIDIHKLKEFLVPVGSKNIELLGCGCGDYTPEEVLPENNIFSWIKTSEFGYDYVLIDCAAISNGPSYKELIEYSDSSVLIFSAEQSFTDEDRRFIDFLEQNKVVTTGAVLNKVSSYSINE